MKKPRIEAFIPSRVPELRSPLDNLPAISPPTPKKGTDSRGEDAHAHSETTAGSIFPKQPQDDPKNNISTDTVISRYHDTTIPENTDDTIEAIRKAVKHLGKEAATYRFTEEEKKALSNVVFVYRNKRVRTSENEITRIAINFLLEDYRSRGEQSLLAKVLEKLKE